MNDEIQQVKEKTDIVALISQYVPLKKSGRNYKGLCPFHHEKTPSFMVSPDLQIFKCFGCGRGGDVFAFLREQEGLEFGEALAELAKRAGVKLTRKREEKSPEEDRRERIFSANHLAAQFYHYLLTKHAVGRAHLEYLKKQRGLKNETIEKFNLGYAPRRGDLLLSFLRKKDFSLSETLEAGLVLKSERGDVYQDRFRNRIVFPLLDAASRTVGFSSRTLSSDANIPKYLNSPETPVFHKSQFLYGLNLAKGAMRKLKRVILVEGQMDLLSNVQLGIENVVATSGSAFTPEQARAIKKMASEIVLCFDNDEAGQKALERAVAVIESEGGLSPLVAPLPPGVKDPDEAAVGDPAAWRKSLSKPLSFYDYFLDLQTAGLLKSDSLGKRHAVEKLLPILAKVKDPLERGQFSKKLSERLDLDEHYVTEALSRLAVETGPVRPEPPGGFWKSLSGGARLDTLRQYFLALLIRFDLGLAQKFLSRVSAAEFNGPTYKDFFEKVKKTLEKSQKSFRFSTLKTLLSTDEEKLLQDLLLFDLGELEDDLNLQEREIEVAFKELKRESLKAEAAEILRQIKESESRDQIKELDPLQKKLNRIYEKIKEL